MNCFVTEKQAGSIPIAFVSPAAYAAWLDAQPALTREWLSTTKYNPKPATVALIPDATGKLSRVVTCVADLKSLWSGGHLPFALPEGVYHFEQGDFNAADYAVAWGLGAYQFTRYKKPERAPAKLVVLENQAWVDNLVQSIYLVRDWTNTPTDDMGPTQFAEAAAALAKSHNAQFSQIVGDELLKKNYASIYTVGRASDDAPRLVDLRWGNEKHPKVTLVGKGVCFDTGGLDIKPSSYMLLMKKDMAGGAHALGLARMIMEANMPICLRVLV